MITEWQKHQRQTDHVPLQVQSNGLDDISWFDMHQAPENGLSKAELCVHVTLQAIQYSRWSIYEFGRLDHMGTGTTFENTIKIHNRLGTPIDSSDQRLLREEDKRVLQLTIQTQQAYPLILESLVERFGVETFLKIVKDLLFAQFKTFHAQLHNQYLLYQPHADIQPLEPKYLELAQQVSNGIHIIPEAINGHVVNVLPLYGDVDFFMFLYAHNRQMYTELILYIQSLPRSIIQSQPPNYYKNYSVDPVYVIRKYFPEVFRFVMATEVPFTNDAIRDKEIPGVWQGLMGG